MDANGLVDSIVKGYFIAATLRLLFNKNKNPLNMETVMNGAKIGAADFGYNAIIRPVVNPIMGGILPRT